MKRSPSKIFALLGMTIGLTVYWPCDVRAEEEPSQPDVYASPQPWEKFGFNVGGFIADMNSSVRVGSGLGVDVDMEELLGLESKSTVFRVDSDWRFTGNRRHRLDLSWFALHRSRTKEVGQDFEIVNDDGTTTTVQAGSIVSSHLDLDIIQTAYSYSFFQDDRADLAVGGGFYVMPINFGLKASGLAVAEGSFNFTAPLPVLGLRTDFALTPKWFLRSGYQVFYVEYQGFKGRLGVIRGALEYLPFKHVGFGLGFDSFRAAFEAHGGDYPNVDLKGSVEVQYTGLQLYGKFFF